MTSAEHPRGRFGWLIAEFFVVVLGVVVGMGVDSWREDRADVALEIGYLERLKANLEADTASFTRAAEEDERRRTDVDAFLDVVDGHAPFPEDHRALATLLTSVLVVNFDRPRRSTYDELINQGDLGRLSGAAVREHLADYYSSIARVIDFQFREWESDASWAETVLIERLQPGVYRWVQAAGERIRAQGQARDFDVTPAQARSLLMQVQGDIEMRNLLFRISRIQLRVARQHRTWSHDAAALLGTLELDLERLGGG